MTSEITYEFHLFPCRLIELHKEVLTDKKLPDEHLYGRAGYLASLMYVQKHLGHEVIPQDIVRQIVKAMLSSGQALAQKHGWKCPLIYAWYKEYYLGAAHGLAGIVYTLMLVRVEQKLKN